MVPELSNHLVIRIAAEGVVSPPTVRNVFRGGGSAISRERVRLACQRLGLPLPETHAGALANSKAQR